jgi:sec-independent protein translocase protein TatC
MPIGPARMPLFDHLAELRMRLVRIVVCLFIAVCVFYMSAPIMGQFLLLPIAEFLPFDASSGQVMLYALDPFESFAVRFEIALFFAFIATSPVILWQLLAFFLPALKPKERKWFTPTFVVAIVLFIIGMVFCYTVILHAAFEWLTDQVDGLGMIEVLFGLAFELPLVIFYLVIFDVIPYKKLRSSWRTVYVALMVICAVITPDASPITMLLLFAAMIALYEISLLAARVVLAGRIKKQNAELAKEGSEE